MSTGTWLVLLLVLALVAQVLWRRRGLVNITGAELNQRLQRREKLIVVDVREPDEFRSGHIPGAVNVPLSRLEAGAQQLDRSAETILVCRSGNRSVTAFHRLKRMGFTGLKNLPGGMMAWPGKTR